MGASTKACLYFAKIHLSREVLVPINCDNRGTTVFVNIIIYLKQIFFLNILSNLIAMTFLADVSNKNKYNNILT